ncbi:S-adenosyl-L-methionine-dependent methyltransferase [Colletotrichum falcatum]|nr:S-adenosyl-L-methionine-dependent methyltransferase [Colletotrichum falcatum]
MPDNPTTAAATAAVSPPNSPPNADAGATEAAPHDNNVFIVADDVVDDGASVSNQSLASSTTSVSSSIWDFRLENGRTYHSYKDGAYAGPNDEQELDRLDLQHALFLRSFDGRLGTAPPNDKGAKVGRVLDVGTGSGIWAIDFGEEHPEAVVRGVDLSPTAASFVPANVTFEVDDIEEPWLYSQKWNYIHSRMMTGAIRNWEKYIQRCFDNLAPGGYLELNEGDIVPHSDDGTLSAECSLMKAVRLLSESLVILGSPYEDLGRLEGVMKSVGFEDVQVKRFKWPTNSWPKDPKYKELGAWNYENVSPNWEGFLMAPLTRALEWTKEEVLVLAMEARKDCGNKNIHAYFKMCSFYGRKPLKTEEPAPAAPTVAED